MSDLCDHGVDFDREDGCERCDAGLDAEMLETLQIFIGGAAARLAAQEMGGRILSSGWLVVGESYRAITLDEMLAGSSFEVPLAEGPNVFYVGSREALLDIVVSAADAMQTIQVVDLETLF